MNPKILQWIYKEEIPDSEKNSCRVFDSFRKRFARALQKTEWMLRKAQGEESVFIGENPTERSEPPKERRSHFRRKIRHPEETGDGGVGDNAEQMN